MLGMQARVITRNEDVSDYFVGSFNDERLAKTGALLFKKICSKMTVCVKRLAGTRTIQVAFSRFLHNEKTSTEEIEKSLADKTNINCFGKKHVLCIQDTVEVAYPKQKDKKENFGPTACEKINGFFAHPGIIVDAQTKDLIGLSSVKTWIRDEEKKIAHARRPIEDKESICWLSTAQKAKENIINAEMITVIGDRESDIYELFDRIPDNRTHLLVRAYHDRRLSNNLFLSEHMSTVKTAGSYEIDLQTITGVRKARKATMAIKYSVISIKRPQNALLKSAKKSITITVVEAAELGEIPEGEEPVFWRILTTHQINTFSDAKLIVTWYSWRWIIEQIFRTMKKKGFNIEESQISNPAALLIMFTLAIAGAITVLSLVNARNGETNRAASDIFHSTELSFLGVVLKKVEGPTKRQKNPFSIDSLSWASWIIARLGGWMGYASESPPGPITMYRGLDLFYARFEGWLWGQNDATLS